MLVVVPAAAAVVIVVMVMMMTMIVPAAAIVIFVMVMSVVMVVFGRFVMPAAGAGVLLFYVIHGLFLHMLKSGVENRFDMVVRQ